MKLNNRVMIKGQGAPVVLIHGMGGTKVWETITDKLAEKYKVIIPTFPGYLSIDGIIEYTDELLEGYKHMVIMERHDFFSDLVIEFIG